MSQSVPVTTSTLGPAAARRARGSWMLFDWAAQPFHTLLATFIYAPYFANAVAANPVQGQALWGYATACAGLAIALCSPLLGAVADATGRRKPWIAVFGAVFMAATAMLWFGRPGDPAAIPIVLVSFAIAMIAVEFATVFNNAMMPGLTTPDRLGRLSGGGWALGYVGGIISLIIMLGFLVAAPDTGRTLIGATPLFGLDPAMREGDRIAGPFTSVWFLIFIVPLFLFVPDEPKRMAIRAAIKRGTAMLAESVRGLRHDRNAALFLIAHMIYADGLIALFVFGGIYGASLFGWTTIQLGVFGVLLAISGTIGCLVGGRLDDRIGPRAVVLASLSLLLTSLAALLALGPDFFGPFALTPPVAGAPMFAASGEKLLIAIGALIGFAAGPLQAASRTLLVEIAPPARITQFFGLLALSGRITSFLGPLSVGIVTQATGSQRIGISILTLFFGAGLILLSQVRAR